MDWVKPMMSELFVEVRDDLLLIGDGDVQSAQVGIFLYYFHEVLDAGNLEVDVFRVDVLGGELFVEESDGERMSQRITD